VQTLDSPLYAGNVTLRTDQTWGISGLNRQPRTQSPYNPYGYHATSSNAYERCKATHRCARAFERYEQNDATTHYTSQLFGGGIHDTTSLFAEFEDWRKGTATLRQGEPYGTLTTPNPPMSVVNPNSHFDPFAYAPLGPTIPSHNSTSNNGLVLNSADLNSQIVLQNKWIAEITETIAFTNENLDIGIMDAAKRARIDVRRLMSKTRDQYTSMLQFEQVRMPQRSKRV